MPLNNIQELEKLVNSELTSKIKKSEIAFNELIIETDVDNLFSIIQFLKSNDDCKFKQLIDLVGADFPEKDKRAFMTDFIAFISRAAFMAFIAGRGDADFIAFIAAIKPLQQQQQQQ